MSIKEEEKVCPLCGQDNNCQHGQGVCWCDTVKIPKYIIDLIPDDRKGKVCVCKSCIERHLK